MEFYSDKAVVFERWVKSPTPRSLWKKVQKSVEDVAD